MIKQLKRKLKFFKKFNPGFISDFKKFTASEKLTQKRFTLSKSDFLPRLDDRTANTGYDKHYIYHSAWAARVVQRINPEVHTDISSILYFSTIVSAFCRVNYFDYRPAEVILDNLSSGSIDLTNLAFDDNSISSLSCMHTLEHIGLGRYGDAIDYDGDVKAINELKRVTAPGGNLLIVVPLGAESRIAFNAHRIYTHQSVLQLFNGFNLKEFALISDNVSENGLLYNPDKEVLNRQKYGCGCYWFEKAR
jgi:Caenorhabditis protein of unknown function, DUF268